MMTSVGIGPGDTISAVAVQTSLGDLVRDGTRTVPAVGYAVANWRWTPAACGCACTPTGPR
jgi:hypothetical protein